MTRRCGVLINGSVLALGFLAGGCAWMTEKRESITPHLYPHGSTQTLAQTPDEHRRTIRAVVKRDAEGLMDDLDIVFMTDRPTRLTKWHDR
jgi:hypothetical protein